MVCYAVRLQQCLTFYEAPCFAQEFAPTSVWFAETQSMFLDSLLGDADFILRYAKNDSGDAIPYDVLILIRW